MTSPDGYKSYIDGLRAVAILLVLAFHAYPDYVKFGFIGVDIFFVISGFLISGIIFNQLKESRFRFIEFYRRRIRRIFPALLCVLFFCLVMGWFFLLSTEYKNLGKHVFGSTLFLSNIILYREIGYFDTDTYTKPLLHLWSLAVEEQFYLLWPLFLHMCLFLFRTRISLILTSITLFSFSLYVFFLFLKPDFSFFMPLTRVWELSTGSIMAWVFFRSSSAGIGTSIYRNPQFNFACFLLLLFIALQWDVFVGSSFFIVPIAVLLTTFLILGHETWVQRHILSHPILVGIGLISYPLYLWHWPLLSFGQIIQNRPLEWMEVSFILVLSFILSWITYQVFEKPIRFQGKIKTRTLILTMGAIGIGGITVFLTHGVPERSLFGRYGEKFSEAMQNWDFPGTLIEKKVQGTSYYTTSDKTPPAILFYGDSHVEQFAPRVVHFLNRYKPDHSVAFLTSPGCPGGLNVHEDNHVQCDGQIDILRHFLKVTPSIDKIVVGGCWNCAYNKDPLRKDFRYIIEDDQRIYLDTEKGRLLSLRFLRDFLVDLSKGYEVYLLLDNPSSLKFRPTEILGQRWLFYFRGEQNLEAYFMVDPFQIELNHEIKRVFRDTDIHVINQMESICPHFKCRSMDAFLRPIYKDEDHMRPFFVIDNAVYLDTIFK